MSRMFPFITETWNPIGGACPHGCVYCWAKALAKRYDMPKYQGPHRLYTKGLKRNFKEEDFVFVQDMSDLFAETVPNGMIQSVLSRIKEFPNTTFLLLTKNPSRYLEFDIPENCVCGATIETNLNGDLGNAPLRRIRIKAMELLNHSRKMVSIEPIMQFSVRFIHQLFRIHPEFVAVGYDNYNNHLDEPKLVFTEGLIDKIEAFGIKVYRKTLHDSGDNKNE